jgi:hypothetical protein
MKLDRLSCRSCADGLVGVKLVETLAITYGRGNDLAGAVLELHLAVCQADFAGIHDAIVVDIVVNEAGDDAAAKKLPILERFDAEPCPHFGG